MGRRSFLSAAIRVGSPSSPDLRRLISIARLARALLVATCLLLAVPALAAAASFEVDSTVDQADENPGDGICKAAPSEACTLRAAIEEVNIAADPANTIAFDPTVFNGQEADRIDLGSPLQTIIYPVSIVAGSGCTIAGISGAPCAGVVGTGADPVLAVEGDGSSISGLSIANGSIGIGVFGEATGFTATGNWIGVPMSGTNEGNAGAGIFIGPGSDGALIGGVEAADRNLIAHNEVGLDIEGASDTKVQGNWFGQPGGGVDPEPADVNIEITDSTAGGGFKAENNEVGAVLSGAAQATAACDGGCNVISSANGPGIDLKGSGGTEQPASGPTTIHGNFIGLNPAGAEAVNNGTYKGNKTDGVLADGASHVTVGGAPGSETNFIVGGETGIASKEGDDFEARGNKVGYAATGAATKSPSTRGVFVSSVGVTEPATISNNQIRMEEGGEGIAHEFIGATISDNVVEGGEVGISSSSPNTPTGSLIEGNLIEDPEEAGIVVSNPDNEVLGNEIFRSKDTGIEVSPPTETTNVSGNLIGGNSAAEENSIFNSGGFAIVIRGVGASRNEVGRNHGSGNEGEAGFIVLRPSEEVGEAPDPNGAKHPTITSAGKTEASGKALPGALVRVFRKASAEEGELAGFLGEGTANGSGEWKVSYAAVPGKTLVTATQTNTEGGTSDLAETVTTPPDPPAPPPATCSVNCGPPPPVDTTKPKVTIKSGPKAKSTSTTAKFKFTSSEAGSTFKCKLDKKAFAKCGSPTTYKKLKPGKHVFKVNAIDAAGNVSAVITRKFTVLG